MAWQEKMMNRERSAFTLIELLEVIARDEVPDRAGRREPRAVKRRPKAFPLLNKPRDKFKEIVHRNRHWKSNPRKSCA